ncbi:MAG: hypothetical protein Q8P93_02170 [bacterium]|nr:hypothetical protein [bacterium]
MADIVVTDKKSEAESLPKQVSKLNKDILAVLEKSLGDTVEINELPTDPRVDSVSMAKEEELKLIQGDLGDSKEERSATITPVEAMIDPDERDQPLEEEEIKDAELEKDPPLSAAVSSIDFDIASLEGQELDTVLEGVDERPLDQATTWLLDELPNMITEREKDPSSWNLKERDGLAIDLESAKAIMQSSKDPLVGKTVKEARAIFNTMGAFILEQGGERGITGPQKKIREYWDAIPYGEQIKRSLADLLSGLLPAADDRTTRGVTCMTNTVRPKTIIEAFKPKGEIRSNATNAVSAYMGDTGELSLAARYFKRLSNKTEAQYKAKMLAEIEIAKQNGISFEHTTIKDETLWSVLYDAYYRAMVDDERKPLKQYEQQFLVWYMVKRASEMSPERQKEVFGVDDISNIESGVTVRLEDFYKTGAWQYAQDMFSQLSTEQRESLKSRYTGGVIADSHGIIDALEKYKTEFLKGQVEIVGSTREVERYVKERKLAHQA